MAAPKLREVRLELQARLGFGAVDNPIIAPILNSFINEAQRQLYKVGFFKSLHHVWTTVAPAGIDPIDFPSDTFGTLNPDKIIGIEANLGSGTMPAYRPITEGADQNLRSQTVATFPARYERDVSGLYVYPPRDADYTLKIEGYRAISDLKLDDDTLSIDKDNVFALALAAGKSHYRHPDAQLYMTKANAILNAVKWENTGPRVIKHGRCRDDDPLPRPVVV